MTMHRGPIFVPLGIGTDEPPLRRQRTGQSAIDFIRLREGLVLTAASNGIDSVITGGRGFTGAMRGVPAPQNGETRTETEWEKEFMLDLDEVQNIIDKGVKTRLTQNQRDALTSLVFRIGAGSFSRSKMLKALNRRDFDQAMFEWSEFNTALDPASGLSRIVQSLSDRATMEITMFGGSDAIALAGQIDLGQVFRDRPRVGPPQPDVAPGRRVLSDPLISADEARNILDFGDPEIGISLFDGQPNQQELIMPQRDIGVFEAMTSAFALENDVWNAAQMLYLEDYQDAFEFDPDFNITAEMLYGTPFELRPDLVADARSQEAFDFLLRWHTRELEHRRTVEQAGAKGIAFSMLAGILSPISLIPFGAGRAGVSVLRGTWRGARAGALGVGASEAVLQANQEFRTKTETIFGITSGTFLMGALGGLGGAMGKRANRKASAQVSAYLDGRVDTAIEDGEVWFVGTDRTRLEMRKLQEKAATNGELLATSRIREIYRHYGKKTDKDKLAGLLDEDKMMLISSAEMTETRNIVAGFDSQIDPKVFKALHEEELLDGEAVAGFMDDAVAAPIRPAPLTPDQTRIADLEGRLDLAEREALARGEQTREGEKAALDEQIAEGEARGARKIGEQREIKARKQADELRSMDAELARTAPTTVQTAKARKARAKLQAKADKLREAIKTQRPLDEAEARALDDLVEQRKQADVELDPNKEARGPGARARLAALDKERVAAAESQAEADLQARIDELETDTAQRQRQDSREADEMDQRIADLEEQIAELESRPGDDLDAQIELDIARGELANARSDRQDFGIGEDPADGVTKELADLKAELDELRRSTATRRAAQRDSDLRDLTERRKNLGDSERAVAGEDVRTAGQDAKLRAGDDFADDMGIFNGIIRELEELRTKAKPTMFDRARMIFLRRKFDEFAEESNFKALHDLYEKHSVSVSTLRDQFVKPSEDSLFEDILVLRKFDEEGMVRSRVDRMALMDRELNGEFRAKDLRDVEELANIGSTLARRMRDEKISNVGELKEFLENGGKIRGLRADVVESVLGHEPAIKPGETPIPIEKTPALEAAEAAWGADLLPLLISQPQGRIMLRSPNPIAHRIYANLAIGDYKITRNYQGIASDEPVELGIKIWHLKISRAMSEIESLRRKYIMGLRFDDSKSPGLARTFMEGVTSEGAARRNNMLTRTQWWRAVTLTLRSDGHARGVPESAVPHIEEAARIIRSQVWGPAAKELGYLGKRVGIDPMNYVFRVYDTVKIRKELPKFKGVMFNDLVKQWNTKYKTTASVDTKNMLRELVEKWAEGILTEPHSRAAPNFGETMLKSQPSLGRTGRRRVVDIDDAVLEPWLESDLRNVMNAYMHTRLPDLEILKKFKDVKMKDAFDQLDLWYEHAIANAPESIEKLPQSLREKIIRKPKTKSEMKAQWHQDRTDLMALRDILRHTYALPADPYTWRGYLHRAGKAVRDINYLRIGGGFAITALGDVAGMALVNGVSRTFGDLVGVLGESIGRSAKASSLSNAELKALNITWSDVMNERAAALFQAGEYGGIGYTALERSLARNSKRMAQISLLSPWTNFAKQVASRGVVSRIIKVAEDLEKGVANPDEIAAIGRAYIGEKDLLKLLELQRKFGGNEGDIKWLGIDKWTVTGKGDEGVVEMKRLVRNMIVADVDRAVMTPGASDSPLFMHTLGGKVLLQFKRFGIAHTQRLLVPGMQGAKAGNLIILNVLGLSVAMGSLVYILKEMANKREVPTDVGRIIQEGIVRSDLWGSIGEMDGLTSAVSAGSLGFKESLGPDTHFGYHGRDYFDSVASVVLGPTYSTLKEGGQALGGIKNLVLEDGIGAVTAAQIRSWRRIMPYQNLFYLDFLFDIYQNGVESAGKRESRLRAIMRNTRL